MIFQRCTERVTWNYTDEDGKHHEGAGFLCDEASARADTIEGIYQPETGSNVAIVEFEDGDRWLVRGDVLELRALLMHELRKPRNGGGPVEVARL